MTDARMAHSNDNGPTRTRETRRGRLRLPLLAIVLLAIVVVLVSGACSAPPGAEGGDGGRGPSTTDQAVAFSQCMRDHGIKAFPDPDASGELTIDSVANNSAIDVTSGSFKKALTACRNLEPAGFGGHRRSADQQSGALAFAQCMRDNGVPDFPDPAPSDALIDTTKIPSTNRPGGMDKLQAAMSSCSDKARAAGATP